MVINIFKLSVKEGQLGIPKEENKSKIYYFLFIIFVILFLAWAGIGTGAHPEKNKMVNYYMWLSFISLAFILFDNLTKKEFSEIDTVTIEDTPISPKYLLLISLILGIFISFRIMTTQTAFVPYPQFQIFDFLASNAFLSGIAGIVEDMFFFSFLFPTLFAILNKRVFNNSILSFVLSILTVSFIFMTFHIFVYGANQPALLMSFIFAIISCAFVFITRSIIMSHAIHFFNNFTATLVMAKVMIIFS
jgi:membrane protease YdiL (CAAX protease family)